MLPLLWLARFAVAAVWFYEGLWCKLLRGDPRQFQIVAAVPYFEPHIGVLFLQLLGVTEVGLGMWAFSGLAPFPCAGAQTFLLVALNANGLIWARHLIHDPAGMVVKNFAFLVLAWVVASPLGRV